MRKYILEISGPTLNSVNVWHLHLTLYLNKELSGTFFKLQPYCKGKINVDASKAVIIASIHLTAHCRLFVRSNKQKVWCVLYMYNNCCFRYIFILFASTSFTCTRTPTHKGLRLHLPLVLLLARWMHCILWGSRCQGGCLATGTLLL